MNNKFLLFISHIVVFCWSSLNGLRELDIRRHRAMLPKRRADDLWFYWLIAWIHFLDHSVGRRNPNKEWQCHWIEEIKFGICFFWGFLFVCFGAAKQGLLSDLLSYNKVIVKAPVEGGYPRGLPKIWNLERQTLIWSAEYLRGRNYPEEEYQNWASGTLDFSWISFLDIIWNSMKPGKKWPEKYKLNNLLKNKSSLRAGRY